ncbi:hypothetical protein GO308_15010 [Sphingomonas sp. SFZ2018-12]|uniref:hypothetical protein n=1 Tax=Sphingomonas sp. SFZ2018-12 TaxID=2683197 RepID=UPI001F0D1EB1|nr:hypothetical protein [Sphingomonas sp. SFZ2018-12]MCH4894426.1 hypothetical protein [Sphingomonas sp. SFZ2018-12]
MLDPQEILSAAITLARQALDMLDSIDASHPAVHLQYAIDVMTDAPIPRTEEEAEAMLQTPECQALMRRLSFAAAQLH